MTIKELKNKIITMIKDTNTTPLKKDVLVDLYEEEDIKSYINDVLQHGCVSGAVTGLIYYEDTKDFFKRNSIDILQLLEDIEEETGEQVKLQAPYYNFLAWLGYEETLRNIAQELDLLN